MRRIALVKTSDRAEGVKRAIELLGINPVSGKSVLLKPNFNTSDPYPASTHSDTLRAIIGKLGEMGSKEITIGERSGPADTSDVMRELGIPALARETGVRVINFEDLPDKDWIKLSSKDSHWLRGFHVARPVVEAECVVCACCLKTHGYGGVFTMSLKLAVGMTRKSDMAELHRSMRVMRKMIAEINTAYTPSLIVLDGIEAFVDGGPMNGPKKRADVILAGTDRIAIDAVGIAILKQLGSNKAIMERKIFEQEQIARAVELGLGVSGPAQIELVTDDPAGKEYADRLKAILAEG